MNIIMKTLRFLLSFIITMAFVIVMNMKIGPLPPIGKFMDPYNGFWANSRNAENIPGIVEIPGLVRPVNVLYDDLLIPHIFAETEHDLYLAVGYVHAFHRLWQMEFQTHAAAGRLSEIVGNLTLDMDRGMRRIGMVYGAENFLINLDGESALILEQYSKGINAHIKQLQYKDYPLEYKLLDYQPEPWTPLKSGLLYKYMSDMLNSSEKDFENTNFMALYGKDMLDLIYPDVDNFQDPVVERPGGWDFTPIASSQTTNTPSQNTVSQFKPIDGHHPNNGSNNWAIAPGKSATGNAILCNDMHLNLSMPSLWFYNQLTTTDMNVFGHSLPGMPFVIAGFTDSIAWGLTNAQRDLVDWFKIEYEDEKRDRYLLDGKFVPVNKKVEEINIRGSESFYDTVSFTVFGPVTYDHSYRATSEKNGYARRWIDHDPSTGLSMFYLINKAKTFDDYMNALNYFTSPAQNVVFASVKGDIAHRVQGKYPLNDFEEGKFIKDGTKSENNWRAYIPNEHNAFWKNPDRGFVSSANQHPADSTYPYYITARSFESYRNRRINNILRDGDQLTVANMKALQFDNYSMKAAESLPFMIDQLAGSPLNAFEMNIVEQLRAWDYYFNANSKPAVYYEIWYKKLFESIWDEITESRKNAVMLAYPTNYSTIRLMKDDPVNQFFDHHATGTTETVQDLILMSFREMIVEISNPENERNYADWASYKDAYVGHQLRIKPLGFHHIVAGGNSGDVVNAAGTTHGPSQRIIVELDPNGVKAWGHYPGGQSGNAGSKYYDNMVQAWANGEYFELLMLTKADENHPRIILKQSLNKSK